MESAGEPSSGSPMLEGITPGVSNAATSFGSTYDVARSSFTALVMIGVQSRPVPLAMLAGKIPVAVCLRISRTKASSRVAISTLAAATRSVSCAEDADCRNAPTITMMANPITERVISRASPRSFFLSCKCVLVTIRSVEGCQEDAGGCVKSCVCQLAAGHLPGRGCRKGSGGVVSQEKINSLAPADGFKRKNRLPVGSAGLGHPQSN